MVDIDLAALYRFPPDFMFELSKEEKEQLVTNCDWLQNLKHSSVLPIVFTISGNINSKR